MSEELRMDEFESRRKGFDKFFALSEALRFRALSRRNRAVGEWAAEKLGLTGDASDRYANAFAQPRIEGDTDETLIARLHDELVMAGVDVSAHRIRRKLEAAMNDAIAEIEAGK
jgi:hypothetical protein